MDLPQPLLERMQSHAEAAYPSECCGFVLGTGQRVMQVAQARNLAAEQGRRDRYQADPVDHLRIQREARAEGQQIIGCYHSHPDQEAVPTETDLAQAWAQFFYLIICVRAGKAVDHRCWTLNEPTAAGPASFVPVDLA